MSVFSKLRDFIHRHRNKFVLGSILIGSTIFLSKYAQQRLREWQEREAKDILERTRKQQHFESTERTCNQTIGSLALALNESISKILDTDGIIASLRGDAKNKVQLWDTLKVLVFVRACTVVYLQVMLVITLRIQLNILGGYLYNDSSAVTTELQEKYLLLCNSLLDDGVRKMSEIIEGEVTNIIGPLGLTKQLKLNDLEHIFFAFQSSMATSDKNPIKNFKEYVIATDTLNGNELFKDMVQDTVDLLERDEVTSLATHCLNRGFILISDNISEYYTPSEKIHELPEGTDFVHPIDVKIPLAKLIPILNGLISKNNLPNQLTQQLISNTKVQTLGANIYECFSSIK